MPAKVLDVYVDGDTFADVLPKLRELYCGTIAYEIEHISDRDHRHWLREEIERGRNRETLSPERKKALLETLVTTDAFERFLRRTYLGQKTFSGRGRRRAHPDP